MPPPAPARPRRLSLTRQCLRSIRDYIISRGLRSGDRLPSQQEWAQILDVSSVVVREAFQVLQALGMVDIQHGRGMYVRALQDTDFVEFLMLGQPMHDFSLQEVVEARAMLELIVLEACIARATPDDIAELERLLQGIAEAPGSSPESWAIHTQFHQVMLRAAGNQFLYSFGLPLLNTFFRLSDSGQIRLSEEAYQGDMVGIHAAYLDAIKRRDFSRTRELVDAHLLGFCRAYGVFPFAATAEVHS